MYEVKLSESYHANFVLFSSDKLYFYHLSSLYFSEFYLSHTERTWTGIQPGILGLEPQMYVLF